MYFGQVLAVLTDHRVTPAHYITQSVALFMFIVTLIGGNMPIFIPFTAGLVGFKAQVDISFNAAVEYTPTAGNIV